MTLTRSSKDENPGFHWAFGLNRLSLKIIGIWPNEEDEDQAPKTVWKKLIALSVPLMVAGLILGIIVPQLYALNLVWQDFSLVIDNLTTVCIAATSTIKLFLLWNSRKLFEPILQLASDHWRRGAQRDSSRVVMLRQARRAKLFTMSGYAIMGVCFVGFMFTPFLGLSVRIVNNVTDDLASGSFLPFQTYYPFEFHETPVYEVVYASQVLTASFAGIGFSVPDNFFGALAFHACAQCQLLSRMIRELPVVTMAGDKGGEFCGRLAAFVEHHLLVIRFVNLVEKAFNMIILVQTVSLTLIICFLIFGSINSLESDDNGAAIVQIFTLSGTALNLMIHMFIYCIASELLAEYSEGIADAVYSYDWHLLPSSYSRQLVIIMIRTEFPLRFTAGKFFYLSLNAYLNIIKSSAGYISVLLAVQGG
ncbi:odorant receptor 22c-like [Trichogramma pretiosum]|uniref:odorant receptor 22c-like n=1 Tax=Trichogramma pretiosum TaxID=7493 RepID=UPI000C718F57|nr:odorant receptor 22c-like [Trichogramma pretiosum]